MNNIVSIREVKIFFSKYLYDIQNYLQIPCKTSLNMCYNSSSCNHGLNFTEKKLRKNTAVSWLCVIEKKRQQWKMVNNSTNIIISHLNSLNIKKKITTYDVGNPAPGFEQAQQCGRVKPVNRIQTPPLSSWR